MVQSQRHYLYYHLVNLLVENSDGTYDGGNTFILASAFGTFGNNGVRIEPTLYTKVVDVMVKYY